MGLEREMGLCRVGLLPTGAWHQFDDQVGQLPQAYGCAVGDVVDFVTGRRAIEQGRDGAADVAGLDVVAARLKARQADRLPGQSGTQERPRHRGYGTYAGIAVERPVDAREAYRGRRQVELPRRLAAVKLADVLGDAVEAVRLDRHVLRQRRRPPRPINRP